MRVETGDGWELRCGSCWDEPDNAVDGGLLSAGTFDHVITDPPYSERTHGGQRHERRTGNGRELLSHSGLEYDAMTPTDAHAMASLLADASPGWACIMTSLDLIPSIEAGLEARGRYVFAPVPIVRPSSNVRLAGDGPSSWTVYMVVARVRERRRWGTLPGAYIRPAEDRRVAKTIRGTKPLALMESIVRDYTRPGDMICDPFTGSGTTGVAAVRMGRRFIGWERDEQTFDYAVKRLRKTRQQGDLFERPKVKPKQEALDL